MKHKDYIDYLIILILFILYSNKNCLFSQDLHFQKCKCVEKFDDTPLQPEEYGVLDEMGDSVEIIFDSYYKRSYISILVGNKKKIKSVINTDLSTGAAASYIVEPMDKYKIRIDDCWFDVVPNQHGNKYRFIYISYYKKERSIEIEYRMSPLYFE